MQRKSKSKPLEYPKTTEKKEHEPVSYRNQKEVIIKSKTRMNKKKSYISSKENSIQR
jgi:hypothetical protein